MKFSDWVKAASFDGLWSSYFCVKSNIATVKANNDTRPLDQTFAWFFLRRDRYAQYGGNKFISYEQINIGKFRLMAKNLKTQN